MLKPISLLSVLLSWLGEEPSLLLLYSGPVLLSSPALGLPRSAYTLLHQFLLCISKLYTKFSKAFGDAMPYELSPDPSQPLAGTSLKLEAVEFTQSA